MKLEAYTVKYRVNNTQSSTTLHLYSDSESQAIAKLKEHCTVPKDANVIILLIQKK